MPKRTSNPAYLAARKQILAGNPPCHWCGGIATEADHLIEYDAGGQDTVDNMVPSCKPCNARRGQRYKARKDAATRARREQATANAFFHETTMPPTPSFALFVPNQPEPAPISSIEGEPVETGREQPRLESARLGGNSFGDAVAAWAKTHQGITLMPWQVYALNGMLEVDEAGDLVRREALISTARQQGKSVMLTAVIGYFLTTYAEHRGRAQNVLSTANQLDRAEAIFTTLAPILVEHFGGKQIQQIGRKRVTMPNGSVWEIRAASSRLHGGSYDLIVVDELWNISPATMDEALRPSMIARPNPLLACFSTAGDASSEAMIQMRERALDDIDTGRVSDTYFAEWSMPIGADPRDEQWWRWANPALGTTVTIKALRAASTKESFLRAHLNQWITTRGAMLDAGVWESCQADVEMPSGGWLTIDSSVDDARYVGVRTSTLDGKVVVDTAFVTDNEDAMWAAVEQIMQDKTIKLGVTPTLQLHLPLSMNHRFTTVGYAELLKYTSLVRSMIQEHRVIHRGTRTLHEHMTRAVGVKTAQGYVISSQKSPGPIEIARCAIWAIALESRPQTKQKPLLVVSG